MSGSLMTVSTMISSLKAVDRQDVSHMVVEGLQSTLSTLEAKDDHYTLFRAEDWANWVTFSVVFAVLIIFDNMVLNRKQQALSVFWAVFYTLFWIACACVFCGWVYLRYGHNGAYMWMSGYLIEWMLSFDNLFVFHMIFQSYGTPDHLKHKPLYYGICGAIFFRLAFIFIGEYLMHAMFFMHFVFGAFLVYTGVKTATADEEDEDPSKHWLVQWLQRKVPFVGVYDEQGSFFVRVPIDEHGEMALKRSSNSETDSIANAEVGDDESKEYGTVDFGAVQNSECKTQWRATMLFLVVVCLEISDLLFAVDSVSAIVASVPDLFLAYTSAVFAMLGLRATFFIIDELVRLFSLLKYGVAAVLTFIGIKLIITRIYHIPPGIVCFCLVTAIASSMVASVIQDQTQKKAAGALALGVNDAKLQVLAATQKMRDV